MFHPASVLQSRRSVPLAATLDVVIVGGTVPAVAAALAAAGEGAAVCVVAPRPYLGEDLCAFLRLQPSAGHTVSTPLDATIFSDGVPARPAHVKMVLMRELVQAHVEVMLGCYVSDVLRDSRGSLAGVVLANRAGRQAVTAKTVIDATHSAAVCRMAGCEASGWEGSALRFERTCICRCLGSAHGAKTNGSASDPDVQMRTEALDVAMPTLAWPAFAAAEEQIRDASWDETVLFSPEAPWYVPPLAVRCRSTQATLQPGEALDLEACRPRGCDRLYVLSGCADVPRALAETLLAPGGLTHSGTMVGRVAAREALQRACPSAVHVAIQAPTQACDGDVREVLGGLRQLGETVEVVPSEPSSIPVLAEVEVLVVGGGTSGSAAAIAAVRQGCATLVVEYQAALGGTGTLGLIGKRYHGRSAGFSADITFPHNIEEKAEWYRREICGAGGRVWFQTLGCGALVRDGRVHGAVVCTPEGRGVVLADVVIDATANADMAVSAGAEWVYGTIEKGDIALQGSGLPSRPLGSFYENTDYLLVDEADVVDTGRALAGVQAAGSEAFDIGTLIQNREHRRIVGDIVMSYLDQIAGRTYTDAVVFSGSDYDSHGYPSSTFFALLPHDDHSRKQNHPAPGGTCYTPYRCMLPRGLDGILVTGLAISMERDASALVRMQLDMANQGYAAGVAAAMAVKEGVPPRAIRVKELQQHLVDSGALPEETLSHGDSFPLPGHVVAQALRDYSVAVDPASAGRHLAIILSHGETALPLVRETFVSTEGASRLQLAKLLGMLGESDGVPLLSEALDEAEWDEKIFQGVMADYAHLPTPVDALVLALGYARDPTAIPALLRKLALLDAAVTLSHHRSIALALEQLGSAGAAEPLAALLTKEGMQGHDLPSLRTSPPFECRTESFREIVLARALYHCGDWEGLGHRILERYTRDCRGLFARHATAVLKAQP